MRRIRVETASIWRTNYGPKCLKVPPAKFQQPAAILGEARDGISHYVETARRLLCIPASSAQSERDFVRWTDVTDMRSRLNENTVEALKFLRCGMHAKLISNH